MPSTYAHKKFGALVYRRLSKDVRELIADNFECYLAGLHGPDVLFYHAPVISQEVNKTGSRMHKQSFEVMYRRAVEVLCPIYECEKSAGDTGAGDAGLAYFIGCFCHYMSDSACHPLVTKAMEETGMTHGKVEMELERYIMTKDGNTPFKYPAWAHIPVSMEVAKAAADFYPGVSAEEFLVSLTSMKAVLKTCGTDSNYLRQVLCKVMEKTGYENKITSLLMSRDRSEILRRGMKEMYEKLVSEVDETAGFIEEFVIGYEDEFVDTEMPERFKMDFYGNR